MALFTWYQVGRASFVGEEKETDMNMDGIQYGSLYTRLYQEDLQLFGSAEGIAGKVIEHTHDTFDYVIDSCQVVTNRDFPPNVQFIEAEYTFCKH